jgi:hypothetical protein
MHPSTRGRTARARRARRPCRFRCDQDARDGAGGRERALDGGAHLRGRRDLGAAREAERERAGNDHGRGCDQEQSAARVRDARRGVAELVAKVFEESRPMLGNVELAQFGVEGHGVSPFSTA